MIRARAAADRDAHPNEGAWRRAQALVVERNQFSATSNAAISLPGFSSSTSSSSADLESGVQSQAERPRPPRTRISVSDSVPRRSTIARPTANPSNTPSEDWPICLPRIVPARQAPSIPTSPAKKPTLEQKCSTKAENSGCRLRKVTLIGGDFEVVGQGELDEEFEVVDDEVPSAVNGSVRPDLDNITGGLDSAFRAGWDDDDE
jgi:hypothetical protein